MGMTTDGLSYWRAESEGIALLNTTIGDLLDHPVLHERFKQVSFVLVPSCEHTAHLFASSEIDRRGISHFSRLVNAR